MKTLLIVLLTTTSVAAADLAPPKKQYYAVIGPLPCFVSLKDKTFIQYPKNSGLVMDKVCPTGLRWKLHK